jgi:hypothetical protein
MKHFFILFLSIFLFFSSCSSDDSDTQNGMMEDPIEELVLLKNIKKDNQIIESYIYNSENKIEEASGTFFGGATRFVATYESDNRTLTYYDDNDQVKKIEVYYNRTGNTVRIEDINVDTNELIFYGLYTLNSSDCNVEKLEFKTPDDIAYYTSAFSYTDSNCSFQRENSYNVPQDPARIVVKSDDKNYYRKSVYATTYTTIYSRNTLESTLYDRDNEIMNNLSYTSAYLYNEDDYPVSEIRTFLNGTVENYTYEYY